MFKDAWEQQNQTTFKLVEASKQKITTIEKQIDQLVERVMEVTVPSAITRYEQRIAQLEKEKELMKTMLTNTPSAGKFEELFEHAMQFLL